MNRMFVISTLAVSCVLMAAPPASAAGLSDAELTDLVFSEVEKTIMRRYFADKQEPYVTPARGDSDESSGRKKKHGKKKGGKGLPPGLAKRDQLPPGLAKRDTLPPGLAKRDLPADLEHQLPDADRRTERIIVDQSVILIEKTTGRVLDILEDVLVSR